MAVNAPVNVHGTGIIAPPTRLSRRISRFNGAIRAGSPARSLCGSSKFQVPSSRFLFFVLNHDHEQNRTKNLECGTAQRAEVSR